jgi:hypothetical protein
VKWLGADWEGPNGGGLYFASDYFGHDVRLRHRAASRRARPTSAISPPMKSAPAAASPVSPPPPPSATAPPRRASSSSRK